MLKKNLKLVYGTINYEPNIPCYSMPSYVHNVYVYNDHPLQNYY